MMRIALKIIKVARSLAVTTMLLPVLYAAPACAQEHTWISTNGNDSNACVEASPCQTFNGALAKTASGGEVSCLNSGSFGPVNITISVIIDCAGTVATPESGPSSSCPAVTINAPGSFTFVVLRNLSIFGNAGCSGNRGGIQISAAASVNIENCEIENFGGRGIEDERTSGATKLTIKNTIVSNNTGTGIALVAAAKNSVVLDNVTSVDNAYGVAAAIGNNVIIARSNISQNSVAGVYTDPGATIVVDGSVIGYNNGDGVESNGTVLLSNTEIMFNSSSISGSATSYGNNRIYGNGGGSVPTITTQE